MYQPDFSKHHTRFHDIPPQLIHNFTFNKLVNVISFQDISLASFRQLVSSALAQRMPIV